MRTANPKQDGKITVLNQGTLSGKMILLINEERGKGIHAHFSTVSIEIRTGFHYLFTNKTIEFSLTPTAGNIR